MIDYRVFLYGLLLFLSGVVITSHTELVWAQQKQNVTISSTENSVENASSQIINRLDTVLKYLAESRQGNITAMYLTVIVFLMGLAFVIFGLFLGQEHKLSTVTRRLYMVSYFALIIPVTLILLIYITNTLIAGSLGDPRLTVAFCLLIPVITSYVLMAVKAKFELTTRS